MTEEEVFRLKPGDLLQIEISEEETFGAVSLNVLDPARVRFPRVHYALVVEGRGPEVALAWQQFQYNPPFPLPRWVFVPAETIASVLHRSRLTRIA